MIGVRGGGDGMPVVDGRSAGLASTAGTGAALMARIICSTRPDSRRLSSSETLSVGVSLDFLAGTGFG